MTRKGDPSSLTHATQGMKPAASWNHIRGANTSGIRQARQITQGRSFVYDGSLAPTCVSCGALRENRRASKCNRCSES